MTHTRDEIMAMSAEELRIEIAKKKGIENIHCDREGDWFGISVRGNHATAFFRDWITDIAAAWELVEEMAKSPRNHVEIRIAGNTCDVGLYLDFRLEIWFRADTAPLAISRAWLIWSEESGK